MGIANKETALLTAQTVVDTTMTQTFSQKPPGVAELFSKLIEVDGTDVDLVVMDGIPQMRKMVDERQFRDLRSYKLDVHIDPWEKSVWIDYLDILGDKSGVVSEAIANFVKSSAQAMDQIVFDKLLANPTCYDGVALLSASHVNVGGSGTSNNLTTSDLSQSVLDTAFAALRNMKDEAGEPMQVTPNLLVVSAARERLAKELTGSDRPFAMTTTGAEGTAGVVAATTIKNYTGGTVDVAVSQRLAGDQFFLMDTTAVSKPMVWCVLEAPYATLRTNPNDESVFYRNKAELGITAFVAAAAGDWHRIYGSVTA